MQCEPMTIEKNINCLINVFKGNFNRASIGILTSIANSQTSEEFDEKLEYLRNASYMNDKFLKYFEKHLEIKSKWVFCYMNQEASFNRTNLHIESWHRILKYEFLKGKRNKRCDYLIASLMRISHVYEYKANLSTIKRIPGTYKRKITERHALSQKHEMNLLENDIIQVFI